MLRPQLQSFLLKANEDASVAKEHAASSVYLKFGSIKSQVFELKRQAVSASFILDNVFLSSVLPDRANWASGIRVLYSVDGQQFFELAGAGLKVVPDLVVEGATVESSDFAFPWLPTAKSTLIVRVRNANLQVAYFCDFDDGTSLQRATITQVPGPEIEGGISQLACQIHGGGSQAIRYGIVTNLGHRRYSGVAALAKAWTPDSEQALPPAADWSLPYLVDLEL